MEPFAWLATPVGIEFTHAVIGVLIALAAYLSYLSHRAVKQTQQLLDGHLEAHIKEEAAPDVRSPGVPPAD